MEETVVDLFATSASTLHLVDNDGPVELTGKELAASGSAFGWWLRQNGVGRGDRVAVWSDNGRAYLEALAGCADAGLTLVNVNTRYGPAEVADLMRRSGCRALISDRLDDLDTQSLGLAATVDANLALPQAAPVGRSDASPVAPFVVFTTSGTTSKPKMVLHQQRSISAHAYDVAGSMGLRRNDTVLLAMPLCGTFGLTTLTCALAAGCDIVVPRRFDVDGFARLIADHHVTVTFGSDDMFHRLIEADADLTGIRLGGYAAFNSSLDDIVQRAEERGARLVGLYGMSEVQALFAARNPDDAAEARARAGGRLVSRSADCRVIDGELQLHAPRLFTGYLAEGGAKIDIALTEASFDRGWFCTGDLAEMEAADSFHYQARMGDSLRLGGFLVAPAEIEAALNELDDIEASQVVAVDRPSGARPVAFVIARQGADTAQLERKAIDHCNSRLARYKVPVRVVAIEEFPTTPSANGTKIQKVKLRRVAASLLETEQAE
ncbi:MAG: AMP-binding protein [Acidimicrobiales bacterium]